MKHIVALSEMCEFLRASVKRLWRAEDYIGGNLLLEEAFESGLSLQFAVCKQKNIKKHSTCENAAT